MDFSFLATKHRVPPCPILEVARPRLIDVLEQNVPRYKLTLLSAPAGFGKTTLLAQWARDSDLPIAWLSLDPTDNEFHRLFRYLFASWSGIEPDVYGTPLEMLLGSAMPEKDGVLSAFVNLANELPGHNVFVLDNWHVIEDSTIHAALSFLIDHAPPTLHVILASRGEPEFPLARYRARGELLELRATELQFSLSEAELFLNTALGLQITKDQVSSLQEQLEGWVAGLQLVGLALQHNPDAGEIRVSGRHRFIADYLAEDVLSGLSETVRKFLFRTSVVNALTAPLCAVITETSSLDCQLMLNSLERQGLFLTPLDHHREWFRYHRLFADVLSEKLILEDPTEVTRCHQRAAKWYLDHDLPDEALRHAIASADIDLTAEICDKHVNAKLLGGELRTIQQWIEMIPSDWYDAYPVLNLMRAGFLAYSGDVVGCLRCIDETEQALAVRDTEDSRWQSARVLTLRCFIACEMNDVASAEYFADLALKDLKEDDSGFRPGIYNALGDVYRRNGRWDEARACYLRTLEFPFSPGVRVQSAHLYGSLADLNLRQGQLREAEINWKKALEAINSGDSWGVLPLPVIGWIYIRLSEISYEWNRLDEARSYSESGIQRAELGGDVRTLIAGYIISGRIELTKGNHGAATDYLERARTLVEQADFQEWISRFERFQLELWLARDHLRNAVDWVDGMMTSDTIQSLPDSEPTQLAIIRARIVTGTRESLQHAENSLHSMITVAGREGRTGVMIEALALRAIAKYAQGERTEALVSLERALRLAKPEGYVRTFADLGFPMARLLQLARSRQVMPDYVQQLLAAFAPDMVSANDREQGIPEPLTNRELEILQFLACGMTNNEIARHLSISTETVKKHTGNIYSKLSVRNRLEAVVQAEKFKLLDA